jgi:hypothetical protein
MILTEVITLVKTVTALRFNDFRHAAHAHIAYRCTTNFPFAASLTLYLPGRENRFPSKKGNLSYTLGYCFKLLPLNPSKP